MAGRNFIPKALFDPATGAIKVVSATKRVTQGVMVRDKIGYVWDTAGDAYQLVNGGWTPTDIKKINANRKRPKRTIGPEAADGSDTACDRTAVVELAADILVLLSCGG